MSDLLEQLDQLEQLVDSITAPPPGSTGGSLAAEASKRVFKTVERLEAQRLGWIGEIDSEGLWGLDTMRTFAHWLGWHEGMAIMAAKRQVHLARTLRDFLPRTAQAARAGDISMEHLRLMVQVAATSDTRRTALASPAAEDPQSEAGDTEDPPEEGPHETDQGLDEGCDQRTGEDVLVEMAQNAPLRDFRRITRRFAQVADPEADDRGYRTASEREHVNLSPTLDGYHLQGFLTPENGQLVHQALRAVQGVPQAGDSLTRGQRQATALAGLARLVLDHGLVGSGSSVRPHLSVLVSWSEFLNLAKATRADLDPVNGAQIDLASLLKEPFAHWEDGSGPIPRTVFERIAADCHLTRIVFGPRGEILNVGRAQRTFTGAKRRGVIARDKTCVWDGCHAPPQISEIHHAERHWADGGDTSTNNAALLCWFHHRHVDARKIAMRWNDGWEFDDPRSYSLPWDYELTENLWNGSPPGSLSQERDADTSQQTEASTLVQ